jgi:O-antigen ligase
MQALPLDIPLRFAPSSWLANLRAMPPLVRSNVVWIFLAGGAAPAGGSAVTVIMWAAMVWAVYGVLARRYPHRWERPMATVAIACATYAAVKLAFALGHSGLAAIADLPRYAIFFSPILVLHRLKVSEPSLNLDLFILGAAFGTLAAAFVAGFQALWLGIRAEGFCGNPSVFAAMTALFGTIGGLNLHSRRHNRRWLGAASLLAALFCIIVSGTRTFWIAAPILAAICLWRSGGGFRFAPRTQPAQIATAALVAIMALTAPVLEGRFAALQSDIALLEGEGELRTSLGQRLVLWESAWAAIRAAPLAGYGYPGRMQAVIAFSGGNAGIAGRFTHPHNGALAALLDAGISGLAALALILLAPLAVALRAPARDQNRGIAVRIALMLLAAYFFSGLFGIVFEHDLMDAAFVLSAMMIASSVLQDARNAADG